MNKDNADILDIRPCPVCGMAPDSVKASRPLGRLADLYRVECECGNGGLAMWSPTKEAAVRLWNWHNANGGEEKLKG